MAIEDGLIALITAGLAAQTPALIVEGRGVQLRKDAISETARMAWAYRSIASDTSEVLEGTDGFTGWHVRIDCHGYAMQDAVALARAIDLVLRPQNGVTGLRRGFAGTLPDADHTVVQGVFQGAAAVDGFSDADRSYVRTLEYLINYNQA